MTGEGYAAGYGAIITPDKSRVKQKVCMEASFFIAYKTSMQGVNGGYVTGAKKTIFSNMIIIDALAGISAGLSGSDVEVPGSEETMIIEINDFKVYGNSILDDCPTNAGYCYSHLARKRIGLFTAQVMDLGKEIHISTWGKMPYSKPGHGGPVAGHVRLTRVEWIDFR